MVRRVSRAGLATHASVRRAVRQHRPRPRLDADRECARDRPMSFGIPPLLDLVLLASSGMMLLAAARDLIIVFLGIELMSISVYALAGINRRSIRSAEGALKYFLLGAFSTAFLLYGIALVYGATGATNL